MFDPVELGKIFRERREAKKMSQSELAEKCNLSEKSISNIELGISIPKTDTLLRLCQALDLGTKFLEVFC